MSQSIFRTNSFECVRGNKASLLPTYSLPYIETYRYFVDLSEKKHKRELLRQHSLRDKKFQPHSLSVCSVGKKLLQEALSYECIQRPLLAHFYILLYGQYHHLCCFSLLGYKNKKKSSNKMKGRVSKHRKTNNEKYSLILEEIKYKLCPCKMPQRSARTSTKYCYICYEF